MANGVTCFKSTCCCDIWYFIAVDINSNTCKLSNKFLPALLSIISHWCLVKGNCVLKQNIVLLTAQKIHLQISRLHRKRYFGSWTSTFVPQNSSYRMFHLLRVYCSEMKIHAIDEKEVTSFQVMRKVSLISDLTWPRWQSLTAVIHKFWHFFEKFLFCFTPESGGICLACPIRKVQYHDGAIIESNGLAAPPQPLIECA